MKIITLTTAILVCATFPFASQAFGNRDAWTKGWAQGVSEFVIQGKSKSQLYLACEDSGSQPLTIIFTDVNGQQVSADDGKHLAMKIDHEAPVDVSESYSHAGADIVMWAWNTLRTGKRVIVSGDDVKPAEFTLRNAAEVLPAFGDGGCVPKLALP